MAKMSKGQKQMLLLGGGALALLYFSGAFGASANTGSAIYNPSTGTYTPGPQGFSRFGQPIRRIRRRGLQGLGQWPMSVQTLTGRVINPSHRSRYNVGSY